MVDPSDSAAVDEVKKKLAGRQVKTVVCLEEEFVKFVNKAFAVAPNSDNGSVTTADDSSKSENGSVATADDSSKSENGSVATADDSSKPENGSVSLEESSKSENAVKSVDNGITETESDVKHGEATAKESEPEKTEVKSPDAAPESKGNGSTTAAIKPLYNEPEIYSTQEMKARPAPTSFPAEKEVNPDSISELDLARRAQEEAIVLLANQILGSAIKRHCSNIHISMGARESVVHYRLNGRLLVDRKLPNTVVTALVARYKMMARLNLAERIEPQDGHIKVKSASKEIVCLISVVPNDHGESIVIWIV
jgi:type II secretory ATPase GspE/PulE/Tfp pilus assembly ATPase PilB-like protein